MTVRRVPLVLALVAALLVLSLLAVRWGKPRMVARVEGDLLAPPMGDGRVTLWVEQHGSKPCLLVEDGSRPREITLAQNLAKARTSVAILSTGLRLAIPTSDAASSYAMLTAAGVKLGHDARVICWLAQAQSVLPAAPFLAAAGPASAILGASTGETDKAAPVYTSLSAGGADLIGVDHGAVYWLEHDTRAGEATTTLRRCSLSGGKPEVVAEERGAQSAVLFRGHLVWTALSPESSNGSTSAVKSRELPDGKAQVIADWLGGRARVATSGDALYVLDEKGTWWLGGARGEQSLIYEGYYGASVRAVVGAYEYLLDSNRHGARLVKRGLTWGAKLRSALGM